MIDATTFGKYRLIAEIGSGGMADVFLAVATGPAGFSKLQVIKRLRADKAGEPELARMLMEEARIAARLNHPNVVQTVEVGLEGEQFFIAMEYLEGQAYHRIRSRAKKGQARFPLKFHLRVLSDVLAGLHHAHELKDFNGASLSVVHRDMSPHNVFVTYDGAVKVVDFGIAKVTGRSHETATGILKGKVTYMAPEQASRQPVDRRADIFCVGIMLWEAITGKRYWDGLDDIQVISQLITQQVNEQLKELPAEVPPTLAAICAKALAANPDDRYATAAEFQADIEEFAESHAERATAREVGKAVAELFSDRMVAIKSIIEQQLAHLNSPGGEDKLETVMLTLDLPPSVDSRSGSRPFLVPEPNSGTDKVSAVTIAPANAKTMTSTLRSMPIAPESPAGQRKWLAVLAVAAVGAVALVAWQRLWLAPHAEGAAPPVSAAEAAPKELLLKLSASPPEAVLLIDGKPLPANPYSGKIPLDRESHVLEVRAPGYTSVAETVVFERDIERQFDLKPDAPRQDPADRSVAAEASKAATPKPVPKAKAPPRPPPPRPSATASASPKAPVKDPWGAQ